MTDTVRIRRELIKNIRTIVGESLSTLPNSELKAVIRDRAKGVRPDYPFITVDYKNNNKSVNSFLKYTYYDETAEQQVYITEQRNTLCIKCFGEQSHNILNDLRTRMQLYVFRHKLNADTGATFVRFTDVEDNPEFLSTDFVDGAKMYCIMDSETEYRPAMDTVKNITQIDSTGTVDTFSASASGEEQ